MSSNSIQNFECYVISKYHMSLLDASRSLQQLIFYCGVVTSTKYFFFIC